MLDMFSILRAFLESRGWVMTHEDKYSTHYETPLWLCSWFAENHWDDDCIIKVTLIPLDPTANIWEHPDGRLEGFEAPIRSMHVYKNYRTIDFFMGYLINDEDKVFNMLNPSNRGDDLLLFLDVAAIVSEDNESYPDDIVSLCSRPEPELVVYHEPSYPSDLFPDEEDWV